MKSDSNKVSFKLEAIKTEQFAIFENDYSPKKESVLSTELQFKLDQAHKRIGVFIGLEFLQGKKVFLKAQISCHFKISDESWAHFVHLDTSKIIVPKDFLAHIAMITTGTSRGVLFAKTESTPFSKFIVPTLNVAEMIPEDAMFDIIL